MTNLAMQRKLDSGEALDVNNEGVELLGWPGHWILQRFVDNKDYCDSKREAWIWSIGLMKSTGQIIASTASDLYQNDAYDCLFLR